MEPDLDRLIDFESGGELFPQFEGRWRDLFARALELKAKVAGDGAGRSRVAMVTSDPAPFCALFLALARSGVDLFFYNPSWGQRERERADEVARPHWTLAGRLGSGLEAVRGGAEDAGEATADGVGGKLRVMIPTGGSSGRVRFAVHDWSTLSAAAYGFQMFVGAETVASHCVLPLYHVSGFMQLIRSLLTVGTIVFGKVEDFEETHGTLFREGRGNAFLSLVPTQLERLLREGGHGERLGRYGAIFLGGGPAPVGLLEEGRELRLPLAPTYGMTETAAQVATLRPEEFLRGRVAAGRALPHAKLAVVDEAGAELPRGRKGRVRVGGPSLFLGYFGERLERRRTLVTEDLGLLDEEGYLQVLGRADRVIISGGEKIDLREVELCLEGTNLLRDVAAYGVEDGQWGSRLTVAYVPKDAAVTEEALREVVRERLARHKMPKVWLRMEALPRNEAGKFMG